MADAPTDNEAPLVLNDLGLKLQTIVPSAIRKPNGDGASRSSSVASTLKGSQDRKLSMVDLEPLPNGWTRIKHPDSGVYYVNEDKGVSTSSDVLNPKTRSLIMEGAEILQRSPALRALLEDQEVDLVLDVQHTGATRTSYYCVSHGERRVFWLEAIGHEEVDIPCTSNKCTHATGSRVHCIEAQYWKHCELFPTTFTVTKEITGELKDALLQAAADRLLVKFSTSPYDKHDLEYMLNVVKEIEADVREGGGHAAWIIARFMALYNDGVLQSSYGQADDYFDIEDTGPIIGPYKRPLLLTIFAPFFFKSPDVYAVELHSFHESFTLARWSSFVHKVDQSIRDSNLLATVLLSTNVGFLAWSDGGRTGKINAPTAAQIVAYISIICSVGSIIIGLAIFKQYRAKGADTPLRAVVVLRRILKEPFGLERLSIICSLPYVLLMWGLIAFLGAFGIIFYEDTDTQVRVPVTVALFLLMLCLFFCMYTAGPPEKEDQKPPRRSRRDRVTSLSKV
ncbi:hypothetical protein OG21DRAFT_1489468 [Imleria badia]|nr:hypothetical protein OG21DRAFT_1489468 [Imleria badia]